MNTEIHQNEMKRKVTVFEKYNTKFHCSMKSTFGIGTLYISKERICFVYNGFMKKKYIIVEMNQINGINKTSQKVIEVIESSGQSHYIKSHNKINEIYDELHTYWSKTNHNLKNHSSQLNKSPSVVFPDNSIEPFKNKLNETNEVKFIPIIKRSLQFQSNDIRKKLFNDLKEVEALYKHCGARNIKIEELPSDDGMNKMLIRYKGISDIVGLETRIEEQLELKQLTD